MAQPHLGGILDPRPGVVTKGFRNLDLDQEEVYSFADYEEDETGDLPYKSLTTSSPVHHSETSGERSRAQLTVSDSKNCPSHSHAAPEDLQEPATDDDEGPGEGSSLRPVQWTSIQDIAYWAIFTSTPQNIRKCFNPFKKGTS